MFDWKTMEHRCGHRREIVREVRVLRPDGVSAPGCLRNISLSGALVHSELSLGLLSYVQIAFTVKRRASTD
jgi:hypothetical protein